MEGSCHRPCLPNEYGVTSMSSENLNSASDSFDSGRTDEDHFERSFSLLQFRRDLDLVDEAVDLPAISITTDRHIHRAQSLLLGILNLSCEHDRTSAGPKRRLRSNEVFQSLKAIFA